MGSSQIPAAGPVPNDRPCGSPHPSHEEDWFGEYIRGHRSTDHNAYELHRQLDNAIMVRKNTARHFFSSFLINLISLL